MEGKDETPVPNEHRSSDREIPQETLPSEDQQYFNESLRAGVRSMRELIRKRKQKPWFPLVPSVVGVGLLDRVSWTDARHFTTVTGTGR